MGAKNPGSFYCRLERLLAERGPLTITEAVGIVGPEISAVRAARAGHKAVRAERNRAARSRRRRKPGSVYAVDSSLAWLARLGRRLIVNEALCNLVRLGRARRVARATYGPPAPRLYRPAAG